MNRASECLCPLPWQHAYIEMNGSVKLCCVARPAARHRGIHDTTVSEFVDSKYMNHIRKQMKLGLWPVECADCKKAEAVGLASHRTGIIERDPQSFAQLKQDPDNYPVELTSLDVRISNECNFKCRSCTINFSHAWRDDWKAIYPDWIPSFDVTANSGIQGIEQELGFWEQLQGDTLKSIKEWHFAGGEALLSDKHYQLLEKLIEAEAFDTKITYTTNFSILKYKQWDILKMLKPFKNLVFHLSLDGAGEKGEYIRRGLNWKRWLKHLSLLQQELPHAKIDMHFVVSIFNVLDLPWHLEQIRNVKAFQDKETGHLKVGFTCLSAPTYLSIQTLTEELKKLAATRLEEMLQQQDLPENIKESVSGIKNYLFSKDLSNRHGPEFLRVTKLLDQRRKQDFTRLFPELQLMEQAMETPSSPAVMEGG